MVYFGFLAVFAFALFLGVAIQRFKHFKAQINNNLQPLISVIVPFRNEVDNLPRLIDSLQGQSIFPHEVLFVDDHSTDGGTQLLEDSFKNNQRVRLLTLPRGVEGKKNAIYTGVHVATGQYCLTLDADVYFGTDFMENIEGYTAIDMTIAPVVMCPSKLWSWLFSLEYMMFGAFNYAFSPFYKSSASGANLLFSREKYIAFNSVNTHANIASGDDHFLLRDFQNNAASIDTVVKREAAVYTDSTTNWGTYFSQRIRWLSKSKRKSNWKEFGVGATLLFYLLGTFVLAFYFLVVKEYNFLITLLGIRLLIDFFVFSNFAVSLGVLRLFIVYPFYFIFYPFLFVSVLLGSLFFQPEWKGRPIFKK